MEILKLIIYVSSKLFRHQNVQTILSLAAVFPGSVGKVAILRIPQYVKKTQIFLMPNVSLLGGACQKTQNLGKCKAGPTSKTTIKGKTSGGTNKY